MDASVFWSLDTQRSYQELAMSPFQHVGAFLLVSPMRDMVAAPAGCQCEVLAEGTKTEVLQTPGPPASIPSIWLCLWVSLSEARDPPRHLGRDWGICSGRFKPGGSPGVCSGPCQSQRGDQGVLVLLPDSSPLLLPR